MSEKKNDGGFAFPKARTDSQKGMSLRDYFAGKIAPSIFSGEAAEMVARRDSRYDGTNWAEVVALNSYEMADAMLKERGK